MHRSALIAAVCASLSVQTAVCQEAFQIANITIKMIKHSGRGNFRIDAKITNPNDFAVFDVRVDCNIKDRRGKKNACYAATSVDGYQAQEMRTSPRPDIGLWPHHGRHPHFHSPKAQ